MKLKKKNTKLLKLELKANYINPVVVNSIFI